MIVVVPAAAGFDPGLVPGVVRAEPGWTGDELFGKLPHALRSTRAR
jgi:hypothetical protein